MRGAGSAVSNSRYNPKQKGELLLNYTENYQLSQWEESDRVLMEDFNSDNQKIEEAIVTVREAIYMEKLADLSIPADATQYDIAMRGIDLTQYYRLELYVTPPFTSGDYAGTIYLRINGLSSGYLYGHESAGQLAIGGIGLEGNGFGYLCFHIYLDHWIAGTSEFYYTTHSYYKDGSVNHTYKEQFFVLEKSPAEIQTLNLVGWNSGVELLPAGTTIRLYGLRK